MKHNIIIIAFLSSFQLLMAQDDQQLFVQAHTTAEALEVFWIPMNPQIWQQHHTKGYTVTRTELNDSGQPVSSEVLFNSMLAKDSSWFSTNAQLANGIMDPVGALLFDSTFQFPANGPIDELDMKYNYIMEEVRNYPEVAHALGLGFVDSLAKRDVPYRYTIESIDGRIKQSVELLNLFFSYSISPADTVLTFNHPDDLSLSDMYVKAFPIEQAFIRATGKAYGDSIVIRWGLNSAKMWETARESGFEVYRTIDASEYELLATVKPWPRSRITEAIAHDSMALAAAGILYGQGDYKAVPNRSLYEQNAIFENNLGFALMTAERSPLAADILGFRFVDNSVQSDSTYTYMIFAEGITDMWDAGKATVTNTFKALAPPSRAKLTSQDHAIRLEWSKTENQQRFSSYTIERSEDGKNFYSLTPRQLVFIETDELPLSDFVYTDSVANLYQDYYYRLRGFDAFGEVSLPAEIKGQAVDLTPPLPVEMGFSEHRRAEEEAYMSWELPQGQHPDLDYYQVLLSEDSEGIYHSVSEPLSSDISSFTMSLKDMDTDRGFFFIVQSVDKNGNTARSGLAHIVVPDLVAPDPPLFLTGVVDSNSYVHVTWEHSLSEDVQGYWLYWGNDTIQEMSPVNTKLLTVNHHSFYLDPMSLTKDIYFCVRAQDDSYNRGFISKIIEVKRLDIHPPITPYEFYLNSEINGISMSWALSPSDDVEGQLLYKKLTNDSLWQLLDTLDYNTNQYVDNEVDYSENYSYFLMAYDYSGNISDTSTIRTANVKFPNEKAVIEKLSVGMDRKNVAVNWSFLAEAKVEDIPYQFEIYKSDGVGEPSFLQRVDTPSFTDTNVQSNVLYNYAIRIRFENGWTGDLSEIKSILVQ